MKPPVECFAVMSQDSPKPGACYLTLREAVQHVRTWRDEKLYVVHLREVVESLR